MALTAFGVPATVHFIGGAGRHRAYLYRHSGNPDGTGKMLPMAPSMVKRRTFYRDIQLLLIGVVVLAMAFAEGSANDWLPLLMVDGHGLAYFRLADLCRVYPGMTVGRFTGGWFIDRYSRVAVVRASALMGRWVLG